MGSKKEVTKQIIIDTTIRLMSLYGYNATTTSAIANEIGISEALIFKYFGTKDNLLREIGIIAAAEILENISLIPLIKNIEAYKNRPFRLFIKSILMERLEFLDNNCELIKIFLVEMQYSEQLLLLFRNTLFPKACEIIDIIQKNISEKNKCRESQTKAILRVMTGSLVSFAIQKHLLHINMTLEEMEAEVEEILNLIELNITNNKNDDSSVELRKGGVL